ncbi:MAG: flagellar basal body-associated FliL family protein [Rhizobiaceae bacterium]|nr:flagellar basal body-associated FliL family protein [Rhizobiaceae bacterium]MCV0407016.1 flagellar basal body-associated FliL family protein [Rhizobiaceae bacterium]
MAKAVATAQDAPAAKPGPSMIVQIAVLLVMTAVAAGIGFASAGFIAPPVAAGGEDHAKQGTGHAADKKGHGDEKKNEEGHDAVSVLPNAVTLPTVTTNLASPSDIWARMELVLVFDGPPEPALTETIHQDLLAFLRTVKMQQIEGASGFQHLRADIEDRVRTRSDGKVSRVLIRTLLFE